VSKGREGKREWKGQGKEWEKGEWKGRGRDLAPQKKISGAATVQQIVQIRCLHGN